MAASCKIESWKRHKTLLDVHNLKANDHPLHLFTTRKYANALGIPECQDKFYLSLWTNTKEMDGQSHPGRGSVFQRMLSNSQNFPEILIPDSEDIGSERSNNYIAGLDVEVFVYVWVREFEDDHHDGENIHLVCGTEFISHYNIHSDVVYVRQVRVYPVSNVVLGVSSREAFQWLTHKKFCHRLLVEVCSNTVLIRSKDVFLAPYGGFLDDPDFKRAFYFDLYVLECSPIQQGLLTSSTELVLSYMGDMAREKENFKLKMESMVANPKKGHKPIGGPFKDLLFSDFSMALNQNINTPEADLDESPVPPLKLNKGKIPKREKLRRKQTQNDIIGTFEYEVVTQRPLFKRMLWRDPKRTFDPLYYIGMSRKQMLKEGLFDCSYVLISPGEEYDDMDKAKDPEERLCMVRCLSKEYDRSKRLFITPLCLFNIMKKPPLETPRFLVMKKHDDLSTEGDVRMSSSASWDSQQPFAKEVHISIIPSPNYSPRTPHEEALKQYFSCRRLVAINDVIAIRSADDPQFWQNTGDDTENRFPCIFFKVVQVKGRSIYGKNYIMDKDNTALIQIGTEHSYVPVMMQTYLTPTPQGFWDRDILPGLQRHVEKLEDFILPHLTTEHRNKTLSTVPPAVLVSGPVGSGKTTLIVAVARRLGIHAFKVNCHALAAESSGSTEMRMKNAFNAASLYSPCILLLQSIHALGRDRDGSTEDPRVANSFLANVKDLKNDLQKFPMIVVATTHSNRDLTYDILECFLHQVNIEVPNEVERGEMIDGLLQTVVYSGKVSIPYIAQRTAGFVLGDLAALVAHTKRESFHRIIKLCCCGRMRPTLEEERDLVAAGVVVQQRDFQTALDQLQAAHSDAIGAPKIPDVTWDDVGGLADVKTEILDTIQLPLQYPELLAAGLRRSGVLLYGPPGTGKTLLAKAVATECSLNFLSVKGPELINMYVGQSEENVREVFRRARSATPCVIFFDELDSLAPNRGKSGDSGGVMDRVVSQLLAELDGLHKACDVFVIGATNRPDLLDPALLRPGRFDKLLYLGVSADHESQHTVLAALTRKFKMAEDLSLERVVDKCPFNLTGADFYALSSDAMLNAVKRKIALLEAGETTDQNVIVEENDFLDALANISPSVTEDELMRYQHLRGQFDVKSNSQTDGKASD